MSQYNSILVCVAPSSPNLPMLDQAIKLAKRHQAILKIFHVISDYPEDTSEWWNVRNPDKLKKQVVQDRKALLEEMEAHAREKGVDKVASELRWGRTFLEVSREAMRGKHDLVMITSQLKHKVSRIFLECPSMDLLQHCPCTLWVYKGETRSRPKRVLATLGGTRNEVACDTLDVKVLRTAAAIAEANSSDIHFVHAMPLYGGKGQKGKKLRKDLAEYIDGLKHSFMERCGKVVNEYEVDVSDEHIHMVTGQTANVIADLVADEDIDAVVMGTRAHEGLPTVLLGTRAVRVFDHVGCDVVAVKPDDFVSLLEREGVVEAGGQAG